ncbi:hypothetical protein JET66_03875 [Pseudomonas putida]|uniref:hypothetical protein n=1 Tax=Pseudomonas putida TaxID=303 RepID=UPI0018E69C26|nr:hypothetical protein [Pseudomonas putida]MBI6923792.1 hypothetical protein [Pseudomonas putida]
MKVSEIIIYGFICVGLFFTGVVWAPTFSNSDEIKSSIEVISYLATILACAVAISALSSWRSQFKHSERYAALKSLLESTYELQGIRSYLHSLQTGYLHRHSSGGVASAALDESSEEELEAAEKVHKAFCQRFMLVTAIIHQDEFRDFPGFELSSPSYLYKLGFDFSVLYADADKYDFLFETRSLIKAQSLIINNTTAWLRRKLRYMT